MKIFNRLPVLQQIFVYSIFIINANAAEKSSTLILKNADYNRNSLVNGKLVSVLKGNVEFEYEDATIHADHATWYRKSGKINFSGNIHISLEDQTLNCNRMDFSRDEKKLIARGNIDFFDQKELLRIIAHKAVYFFDNKHLTLTENPQLFRYDTTLVETLSITGARMTYDDSLKTATVKDNVLILKGLLRSKCQNASYNIETGIAEMRINPLIFYDIHELTGDSVDLFFIDEILRGVSVMRNSRGFHRDVTSLDTIFTEVTGDSIYMVLSDSGAVETIWTYDDARAKYYSSDNPLLVNEADGKVMVVNFTEGTTGALTIFGNAESLYYLDEDNESGKNEASGDSITINFNNGKAFYIRITGDVRGTYFAERVQ